MVRRYTLIIVLLIIAALFLIYADIPGIVAQVSGEVEGNPIPRAANDLVAAPKPLDGRLVSALSLQVSSDADGNVLGVEIVGSEFLNSFAPNVLGLSGPWGIALVGEEITSYGVLDPRLARVEGSDEDEPHSSFIDPDTEWQLVVPLFDGEKDLSVEAIVIVDDEGNVVFSAVIDTASSEVGQIEFEELLEILRGRPDFNDRLLSPGLTTGQ
jgi:hypothetical protein